MEFGGSSARWEGELTGSGRRRSHPGESSKAKDRELRKAQSEAQVGEGLGIGSCIGRKRPARSGGRNGRQLDKESR